MIKKSGYNFDKRLFAVCGLIFCAFALLVYLVPYSHDDWAWGCQVGLDRLESNFVDYNGRYFGNYMILAITRSKLLEIIAIASSALLLCCLPGMFLGKNTAFLTVFSALLLLLMPKSIFSQTVVWASGYSNYMPPIIITVIYFVLIRNIFGAEKPKYNKVLPIISLILGVAGGLFMEHVTLYNLAVSFLVILFVFIKHKKLCLTHVAFAVGALAGTVIMYSNSAYGLIAGANDAQGGYRTTALSGGLLSMLKKNVGVMVKHLFTDNTVMLLIITALVFALGFLFIKKSADKRKNNYVYISLFVNILSFMLIFLKSRYSYWNIAMSGGGELITLAFICLMVALYCLSVLTVAVICISDKDVLFKALLSFFSVPVVTAPLLIVNPVSSRCFLPQYFLMMIFCVLIFGYIRQRFTLSLVTDKTIKVCVCAVLAAVSVFMLSIYSTIYLYAEKRDEYIKKQIDNGEAVVRLCEIPNSTYIYLATPKEEMWTERFKLFYGIDENIEFEVLSYDKFDKWAKEYDSKEAVK